MTIIKIVQHRVPVTERPAPTILPAHPHAHAFCRQRGKGQRFCGSPVQRVPTGRHLPAYFENFLDFRMRLKIGGQLRLRIEQSRQRLFVHARLGFVHRFRPADIFLSVKCQDALRRLGWCAAGFRARR